MKVTNEQISAVMAELGRRGNLGRSKGKLSRAELAQRRKAGRRSGAARRAAARQRTRGRKQLAQKETERPRDPDQGD